MISNDSKRYKQTLTTLGQIFVNPINNVFIQFAIEVDNPSELPFLLEKVRDTTVGLYTKTDGLRLYDNNKNKESIKIHRIPRKIKNLEDCCDWINNEFTPDSRYSMATIASDDTRVVVNSNHALTDGGYFVYLLDAIQRSSFDAKNRKIRDVRTDLFKSEFDDFLKKNEKRTFNSVCFNDITRIKEQEIVNPVDSYDKSNARLRTTIKITDLSHSIFDRKTGKIKHMSEFLWTGLCMAINAKNNEFGKFGVGSCMDLRRLIPKEKVDLSFGSAYTDFYLPITNVNSKLTIEEICSLFRKRFNEIKNTDYFFKEYLCPSNCLIENMPMAHVSNVGQIKIKSPLKDFYIQCSSNEFGLRPFFQITSYSKMKIETGLNDLVLNLRYSPVIVSNKNAYDIFETFFYFLKNVDALKKSGDVLDELIHFQNSLNK